MFLKTFLLIHQTVIATSFNNVHNVSYRFYKKIGK